MIKTMNIKMTTNSQLSTTEPQNKNKSKLSKQLEQEQNHRNGDHMDGYQQGGGEEGKVQEVRSINSRYKIQGEVKNSMGNGEAKELICMTQGHAEENEVQGRGV